MIALWIFLAAAALWLFMIAPRLRRPPMLKRLQKGQYAHRGLHSASAGIPENSMAAFALALEKGFGMELDVHLSKDGRLVVEHDDSLLRTCGVDRPIEDCCWDEISQLTLEGTKETLPLLEQVLALVAGKAPLVIEAKAFRGNQAALIQALVAQLEGYKGDFCIESFDPRALYCLRKIAPQMVRGQLSGRLLRHGAKVSKAVDFAMRNLLVHLISRPDFIAFDYRDSGSPPLNLCRALFRPPLFLWTLRSAASKELAQKKGAIPIFEEEF